MPTLTFKILKMIYIFLLLVFFPIFLLGQATSSENCNDDLVGTLKMSFSENKASFAGVTSASYRIEGDSLFIDMSTYEMAFVMDGNTIKTLGPAGKVAYTKK
jgi:hypothetical protein